jgi:DNA-binding NtrC family response regulator
MDSTRSATERTILVVEDEAGLRALVEEVLSSEGYTVLMAPDGANAVRLSEEYTSTIHLLLTDITLPGMNGQQIAARLRPARPQMQLLFMSGHARSEIVDNEIPATQANFIQKPWTPQGLCDKVQALLNTQTATADGQ